MALQQIDGRKATSTTIILLLLMHLTADYANAMMPIGHSNQQQAALSSLEHQQDQENRHFLMALRIRALQNLQRSLESLSSLTANSLMLNAALQSSESATDEVDEQDLEMDDGSEETTMRTTTEEHQRSESTLSLRQLRRHRPSSSSSSQHSGSSTASTSSTIAASHSEDDEMQTAAIRPNRHGVRRIRADLKQMPRKEAEEMMAIEGPATDSERPRGRQHRRMRSTNTRHHGGGNGGGGHHRRRKKGCPAVHGKDQLLCPTRNTQRYDVCITREQLCDRVRDCPGGEDEDSRHCFFFRPLESSLKTISHAVLLLVDTVMREQEEHQQQQQERNEL